MDNILYCVFLRNGTLGNGCDIISNDELIGVFDTKECAKSIMDLIDAMFGDYDDELCEENGYMHCFCMEYPKNKVSYHALFVLNLIANLPFIFLRRIL